MGYVYLTIAIISEVIGTAALKPSQEFTKPIPTLIMIVGYAISFVALALTLLQDQLQSITQYWRFVLGAILAAMVIFFPRGLAGIASDFAGLFSRRKREAAA